MFDRLESIEIFLEIADLGGFARAARHRGISPSVVTRMIAALEERLGVRLFQRTTRQVKLTDAGARYQVRAQRFLADLREAEAAAQAERSVPSGNFVVAASTVFGRIHVAPVLGKFLARHPLVTGELRLDDRVVNLVEEGIDAAVRIGFLHDSNHHTRKVGQTRRVLVGSGKYLAGRKKCVRPEDISEHHVIHCTALGYAREWRFMADGGERRISFVPHFVTNNIDVAIGQAERGGGLTMVLAYQVEALVRQGKLKVVLSEFELPPSPIQIVYPSNRLLSAKVRAFIDFVVSNCDWQFRL